MTISLLSLLLWTHSSSLFLSCAFFLCISPLFRLSHSLLCLGPRPQKEQVAFSYRAAQAALILFATAGNRDCAFVCARCYSKPPHQYTDPKSTVLYFKTLACMSDHNATFGVSCPYEVNKNQTQDGKTKTKSKQMTGKLSNFIC